MQLGRSMQGRGRRFKKGPKRFPKLSQGSESSHPLPLISISYAFPIGCHGRGQHSTWTKSRLLVEVAGPSLERYDGETSRLC